MQTIQELESQKIKYFATQQRHARKDVECVFGVLQSYIWSSTFSFCYRGRNLFGVFQTSIPLLIFEFN